MSDTTAQVNPQNPYEVIQHMASLIETWLSDPDGSDNSPLWEAQEIAHNALEAAGIEPTTHSLINFDEDDSDDPQD